MKQLILLILLVSGGFISKGQDQTDLDVYMNYPVHNGNITAMGDQWTDVTIINQGPAGIDSGSVFSYGYTIDGSVIWVKWQGAWYQQFYYTFNRDVPVGDTVHVSKVFKINFQANLNGTRSFCMFINEDPVSNKYNDINLSNNASCRNMILIGGGVTSDIDDLDVPEKAVSVYPNPIAGSATLQLSLEQPQRIAYRIADLTGRTLVAADLGMMQRGQQELPLSTENLEAGVYLCNVQIGGRMATRRIVVR